MSIFRNFWADHQKRRTVMWVLGVLGVLLLTYGLYTLITAHDRYTTLRDAVEALGPPTDPNDTSNLAFAMLLRDRDRAEKRRWQGVMFAGMGMVGLGIAYLFRPDAEGEATISPPGPTPH